LDKKIQGNQAAPSQVNVCLFSEIYEWSGKFEKARDTIRQKLHSQNPAQFPYGTRGTSVSNNFAPQNLLPPQVLNVLIMSIWKHPLMTD